MIKYSVFSLLSAALLYIAWPPIPLSPVLLVAFVPILLAESFLRRGRWLLLVLVCLLLWNSLSTFWIYNLIGWAFVVHLANSLIFTIPFIAYTFAKPKSSRLFASTIFLLTWVLLEYMQLNWDLAYPFLNLGNGLSTFPQIIQWYEFIGSLGGTIWIILANLIVTDLLVSVRQANGQSPYKLIVLALVIFVPIIYSMIVFYGFEQNADDIKVTAIQTGIDCRTEKYQTNQNSLIETYLEITNRSPKDVELIVWPETALTDGGIIQQLSINPLYDSISLGLAQFQKQPSLVTGAILYKDWGNNHLETTTYFPGTESFLSLHNAALQVHPGHIPSVVRGKSRLVPFEEAAPRWVVIQWLRKKLGTLGGFTFSEHLSAPGYLEVRSHKVFPLICYEILFGEEIASSSYNSDLFLLMLNEGWYNNKNASLQFLNYTSARAIESRRSFVRSSNMGFAAFINQKGEIISRTKEPFTSDIITGKVGCSSELTFYAIYGDLISLYLVTVLALFGIGVKLATVLKAHLKN